MNARKSLTILASAFCMCVPLLSAAESASAPSAAQERHQKEDAVRKQCAVARYIHDNLYKSGVADPDKQVDVRAVCEPDEVAHERVAKWIAGIGLAAVALFALCLSALSGIPG